MKKSLKKVIKKAEENKEFLLKAGLFSAFIVLPMISGVCNASDLGANANLPWTTGVKTITTELQGPLPKAASIMAIAGAGGMLTLGEFQGITKRAIQIVIGLGVAVGAPSLISALTGTTASALLF